MSVDQWSQALGTAVPIGLMVGVVVAWVNSWRV